jgi:hypothetical protein
MALLGCTSNRSYVHFPLYCETFPLREPNGLDTSQEVEKSFVVKFQELVEVVNNDGASEDRVEELKHDLKRMIDGACEDKSFEDTFNDVLDWNCQFGNFVQAIICPVFEDCHLGVLVNYPHVTAGNYRVACIVCKKSDCVFQSIIADPDDFDFNLMDSH